MNIRLYGIPTQGYLFINTDLREFLDFHKIEATIIEINDTNVFLESKINSVPAVSVNSSDPIEIHEYGNIHKGVKEIYRTIVSNQPNDAIRRILIIFDYSIEAFSTVNWIITNIKRDYYSIDLLDYKTKFTGQDDTKLLNSVAKNLELSYVGDLPFNLLIQAHYYSNWILQNMDFDQYEVIFLPFGQNPIMEALSYEIDDSISTSHDRYSKLLFSGKFNIYLRKTETFKNHLFFNHLIH